MGRTHLTVRPATLADIPGIRDVAHETWRATYRGHIPDEDIEAFLAANYSMESLTRTASRLGDGLMVATREDEVIGYATLSEDREGMAQLWSIYVVPEFQGQGAGKLLWDTALERARILNLPGLVVWVLKANETARNFYARQGAQPFAEREFPVGDGSIQEIGYRLPLS